jgi:OOP family OmpA-OmpF porin
LYGDGVFQLSVVNLLMRLGMHFKFLLALGVLLVSALAHAVPPLERGGYIGGGIGASELDDDNFFVDNGADLRDDEDSALQLLGGYRFNRHFAVEGRYVDLGEFDVDGFDLDVDAVSVHAVLLIPIGNDGWELYGQLGLGRINVEILGDDQEETVGSAGLGVRYFATENLGIGLSFDGYAWEEDDSPNGRDYDIAVTSAVLRVEYIF